MNDFILYTDSACDLPEDMLKSLGIHYRSLTFAFEGESEHGDREVPAKDFYAKMCIALKEASETHYWLKLLYRTDFLTKQQFTSLNSDITELIGLLTAICKSTQASH